MSRIMTANAGASETRKRIIRMGDRRAKNMPMGIKLWWLSFRADIYQMDDAQNKRPGGLGKTKKKAAK